MPIGDRHERGTISALHRKPARRAPMERVDSLHVSTMGIAGASPSSPIRQILLVPESTLFKFQLAPGDLRENVVIAEPEEWDLHALPSGTVLALGDVRIRLTVHCEPCARLLGVVPRVSALLHKRGYLGAILNEGVVNERDEVRVLGVQFEAIPFDLKSRASWYLAKQALPVPVTTFVRDMGLPTAYCRAVPRLVRDIPGGLAMISFGQRR